MDYTRNWLKGNPENFPVASRLLPKEARAPLLAFYAFARGADEIADRTRQDPRIRQKELHVLEEALSTFQEKHLPAFAIDFIRLAHVNPPLASRGRDLLSAFMQDTIKSRYHDIDDLIDYCQRSAASVGRAFLYICGETKANLDASDSLCTALQLLNHIQDAGDDYVNLDRVYLPLAWFSEAGITAHALASSESSPELRRILDRALDHCDTLLAKAQPLLATLHHKKVRREAAFITQIALALAAKLRRHDPLAAHVRLSKPAMFLCLLRAVFA